MGETFDFDRVESSTIAEPAIESESRVVAPEARLVEIAAIFDHAGLNYFARAELALEYVDITEQLEFGQHVQKGSGRPGIISKTALALTLPGKTDAARVKWLQRALKIAEISPAAKAAAKQAKVARYQSDLFAIADAGDESEQLKKVAEIAALRRDKKKGRSVEPKSMTAVIRFPANRKKEILALLATFAETNEVDLLSPASVAILNGSK
jgi:hypothetical protein